jgi:hypothetical protein
MKEGKIVYKFAGGRPTKVIPIGPNRVCTWSLLGGGNVMAWHGSSHDLSDVGRCWPLLADVGQHVFDITCLPSHVAVHPRRQGSTPTF